MNDLRPELIAAIATRLYRQATDTTAPALPPPPVMTDAMNDARAARAPSSLTAGLPEIAPAVVPAANPTVLPDNAAGADPQAGLRAFVRQVRFGGVATSDVPGSREPMPGRPCQALAGDDGLTRAVAALRAAAASQPYDGGQSSDSSLRGPGFLTRSGLPASHLPGSAALDVETIRRDFPALRQTVHGKPLIWMDNAATTQKPQAVIDAVSRFYTRDNSNIHRAAHALAARATDAYERAREQVRAFLNASAAREIVFVRGTTEGINWVANVFGRSRLGDGDEILLTTLEHHANIVPWQMVARATGARIRVVPVNDRGEVLLDEYQRLLGPRTRLVGLVHACNSLGTILPVEEMTRMAKQQGARVLIDGAQSVAHIPVNVQELGCDFYVFSGHKLFGPTGIGAVYATPELLDGLPPWQGGGNMIRDVTFEHTTYADPPARFEAGTPNIADAVGLGAAIEYVQRIGLSTIARHEHALLRQATEGLSAIPGLRLIGTAAHKVGVLSFVLDGHSPEEIGKRLDREGIAVRAGHHCAQPSLRRFGVEATVRPSLAVYNTHGEVEKLIEALRNMRRSPTTI